VSVKNQFIRFPPTLSIRNYLLGHSFSYLKNIMW